VGILLGLLFAVAYGSSDFAAGLGSRRLAFGPVTAIVQAFGVAAAGAAAGHGQLAVVAVLTSLYPAVTVLLARVVLTERWSRLQAAGLLTAATAITLVSIG
jgi:uncharacterized membrane protein